MLFSRTENEVQGRAQNSRRPAEVHSRESGPADFSLAKYAEEGVGTETLDDLMRIFLAGWKSQPVRKENEGDGFTAYSNGFTASYGWERVMIDMFFAVGETLCDGSELNIDCDDGVDQVVVEDGSVTQVR